MVDQELLTESQVWRQYGLSVSWQRRTRRERRGPRFLKLGKMVRYRRADIEAYLAAHVVQSPHAVQEVTSSRRKA